MTLRETIDEQIKQAMRDKAQDRLRALRAIKSLILLEATKGGDTSLSSDDELKLLGKAAKQRRDSAAIYEQQGRQDLLTIELAEIAVIEEFLPKQLSQEELIEKLKGIIASVGATSAADMGKIMGPAMKQLAGLADGKAIQNAVKAILG